EQRGERDRRLDSLVRQTSRIGWCGGSLRRDRQNEIRRVLVVNREVEPEPVAEKLNVSPELEGGRRLRLERRTRSKLQARRERHVIRTLIARVEVLKRVRGKIISGARDARA